MARNSGEERQGRVGEIMGAREYGLAESKGRHRETHSHKKKRKEVKRHIARRREKETYRERLIRL